MMQQIAKQQLHTIWAIWYWLSTAMPHTQVSQKHAAEWGALLLIQKHQLSPNMGMVHNTIQSSMQSCHQPWKKNLGALYINAKQAAPLCQMLCELGHPWPPMLIQTNNFIAYGIIAGIPKIPNTNSGQQTNDLGKKTQPKMWERDRSSQTWEAVICFYVDEPASSGKNTSLKIPLKSSPKHA